MKQIRHLFLLAFILMTQSVFAQNQFEGELTVKVTSSDSKEKPSITKLYINPNRIRVDGVGQSVKINMLGDSEESSILIRLDKKDFILFSKEMENVALRFSKLDIENMMNMARQFSQGAQQNKSESAKLSIEETKETKSIAGYLTKKIILRASDAPGESVHIWIADQLNIHLGMLTENWDMISSSLSDTGKWLKQGQFPLLAEHFKEKKLISKIEVTSIKKKKVSADKLDIPAGVQLMSFQDMLMKNMMGQ